MRDAALLRTSHEQQLSQTDAPLENGDAVASWLEQNSDDALRYGSASSADTQHHQQRDQQREQHAQQSLLRELEIIDRTRRAMVVALFRDGFVCRHFTDASESVEGFAQPYDSDASYFLGCIERGVVPDGLVDMITGASSDGSVVAEMWDYRESSTACPLSSVALPRASPLAAQNRGCEVWEVLLKPGESSHCGHASEFDHFPELSPGELEILAGDAERQLLEIGIPSSWNAPSQSDCQPDLNEFGLTSVPQPGFEGGFDTSVSIQDVWIDAELRARAFNGSPTGSCNARLNLVLDQDAFASLESSRRTASSVLLSPTEPKRQVISEAQRQQIARQKQSKKKKQTGAAGTAIVADGKESTNNASANVEQPTKQRKPRKQNTTSTADELKPEKIEPSSSSALTPATRRKRASSNSNNSPSATPKGKSPPSGEGKAVFPYSSLPPLPATQHFLSKLKGKRQRRNSFEKLQYGMPVRLTINHIGIFFRAAMRFECQHAFFLHTNVTRIMTADEPTRESDVSPVGSMDHLAEQLGGTKSPAEVVAHAVKPAQEPTFSLETKEQSENWGAIPIVTAANTPRPRIRSLGGHHGCAIQAYPIQLPAPQVEYEIDLASLRNAWLALADPPTDD